MPRPPILPTLQWQSVFESGLTYEDWLDKAEKPENRQKMEERFAKTEISTTVANYLRRRPRGAHVVAIAEDWCGDVVRHVPVLAKLAEAAPDLHVRFVTREQYPDVFARFLTNGGEAIPKFVFLTDNWVECGNWGPMPEECKVIIARGKAAGDVKSAREKVGKMYEQDGGCEQVINELLRLIDTATCTEP